MQRPSRTDRIPLSSSEATRLTPQRSRRLQLKMRRYASIIGFPVDDGIRRNGGRTGAANGPKVFRESFRRLSPLPPAAVTGSTVTLSDIGDIVCRHRLEDKQEALGKCVAACLKTGVVPIVIGGGHETSYGHFLGYVGAGLDVQLLNWDAHPDVRPLINGRGHSGSPFRQALQHPSNRCLGYQVAGLLPHSIAPEHLAFIQGTGGRWVMKEALTRTRVSTIFRGLARRATLCSFDLDAVDQSCAPGVSAPACDGMSVGLWLYAAYRAGRSPAVRSVDIVELNPRLDRDGQTSRLAALTVWCFLKGLSQRPGR